MALHQVWLTTLDHVKEHRDLTSSDTGDDDLLKSFIQEASMDFVNAIRRLPVPYIDTVLVDAIGEHIGTYDLDVKDLLAITTLTNGDATEITSGQYVLESPNEYPKWRIRIKQSAGVSFTYTTDWEQAISIAGTFGYMPHWGNNALVDSGVDGTLAAISTTSMDIGQNAALFEVGQYIKIEDEYLRITAITDNTTPTEDTLTLVRGELGSTAVAHTAKDIYTVNILQDIKGAVREMVVYWHKTQHEIGGQVQIIGPEGRVVVNDIDSRVGRAINRHRYDRHQISVV